MIKKLKNFICKLFNIKACQCDDEPIVIKEEIKFVLEKRKKRKKRKKTRKAKHQPKSGRSSKYFGSSYFDYGLFDGGSADSGGGDGGGGE